MSKKPKRSDFQAPEQQRRTPTPAAVAPAVAPPVARPPKRQAWWPLVAAFALTGAFVLLMIVLNLDSPPIPTAP